MNVLVLMVGAALMFAGTALVVFFWSLRSGQFEDPAGDAARILVSEDKPLP